MQLSGTVKFFDARGFGFIAPSDGLSEDIYFHVSELPGERGKRSIPDGQAVTFDLGVHKGKTVAKNVRPLSGGAQ